MNRNISQLVAPYRRVLSITVLAVLFAAPPAVAADFDDIGASLIGVTLAAAAWGDYDNDGDLDILLAGRDAGNTPVARVYRNDGGAFTDIGAGLTGVYICGVAWGDYDNDGDLDILLSGNPGITKIYRNDGGVFTDIGATVSDALNSAVAWGDCDNDGDLDFFLVGSTTSGQTTLLFRNDGGTFSDSGAAFAGSRFSTVVLGDYDADGDLDVFYLAFGNSPQQSFLYRNDGNVFSNVPIPIGATSGSGSHNAAWGDFDNDGDLDLAVGKNRGIYRNDGGVFTNLGVALPFDSLAWGDYDNDGDLDLLVSRPNVTTVFRNDGNTFTDIGAVLNLGTGLNFALWGDYDNDGDLDILVCGSLTPGGAPITRVYRNNTTNHNTPPGAPAAPTGLTATAALASTTFSWTAPADDHTPSAGLCYALRIGSTPGGSDILAPEANPATGYRRNPVRGPIQTTSWTLNRNLPPGDYYWSVQAIDGAFNGSPFATEGTFHVNAAPTDLALSASTVPENRPAGTAVGTFSSTDPDAGDTFTYTLAAGGADNAAFQIVGTELRTAAVFDFETTSSYAIRVRTTDAFGLFFEMDLTVMVTDVNEQIDPPANNPPVINSASFAPAQPKVGDVVTFTVSATDPENAALTIGFNYGDGTSDTTGSHSFASAGTFTVVISVSDGVNTVTATLTVTVSSSVVVDPVKPGDADADNFDDFIETALLTDPNNFGSRPFKLDPPENAGTGLTIQKLVISTKSPKTSRLVLNGSLPVPAGFKLQGTPIILSIGGVVRAFVSDKQGLAPTQPSFDVLRFGALRNGRLSFRTTLRKGDYSGVQREGGGVRVIVIFGGFRYELVVTVK